MTDSTTLTLICGPTIRHGTEHASLVRSQLMRPRYHERRHRILRKNTDIDYIQINIQRHEIQTETLPAGTNLGKLLSAKSIRFSQTIAERVIYDFLLHSCRFRNMVVLQ
jgi:hypothetical protein